jgi:hypothetical protein
MNTSKLAGSSYEVPPNGNIHQRTSSELRGYAHSNKTPTGLYVSKGDSITVIVEAEVNNEELILVIGQYGAYANINNGENIDFTSFHLVKGNNSITFDKGVGMIYFINSTEDRIFNVEIIGARKSPTFEINKTSHDQWIEQLNNHTDAPFGELIGDHSFATMQYETLNEDDVKLSEINNALNYWDIVYQMQNEVHGLIENGTGVAKKHNNRIHFSNPDEGAGYASATSQRVTFQKSTGAGKALIKQSSTDNPILWVLLHEVGHTYQNQLYKPEYAGEVTVNIPAYIIREKTGHGRYYDTEINKINAIRDYLNSSEEDKNFQEPNPAPPAPPFSNDTRLWVRLGMWIQLYHAYGENFYPRLNQVYRVYVDPTISGDDEKLQEFIVQSSLLCERNLKDFYIKWGVYPTKETLEKVAHLPELTVEIWRNIIDGYDYVDDLLPPHSPPNAQVVDSQYIIGELLTDNDISRFVTNIEVSRPPYTVKIITDNNVSKNTSLSVIVVDSSSNINRFSIPIEFKYGNSISFTNYTYGKERIILTIQPHSNTFEMFYDRFDKTPIEGIEGTFAELHLFSPIGEKIHFFSVTGRADGSDFAKEVSGTSYVDGQIIKVVTHANRRMAAYRESESILPLDSAKSVEYFKIHDDKLEILTNEDIRPKATLVPTQKDIGVDVTPDEMLKDIIIMFGTIPIVEFIVKPNIYIPGRSIASIKVTDEENNSTVFDVPFTVRYNTAISLTAYASQERVILRINPRQKIIEAFSNPAQNTAINSGNGKYYEIAIYSVDLIEKARFSANREEKPFDFVASISGSSFEDEDYIHIYVAERRKIAAFSANNQLFPRDESLNDEWFRIAFGELKRVSSPF